MLQSLTFHIFFLNQVIPKEISYLIVKTKKTVSEVTINHVGLEPYHRGANVPV